MRTWPVAVVAGLLLSIGACSTPMQSTLTSSPPPDVMSELWIEPSDIAQRDLLHGAGGAANRPKPTDRFDFLSEDRRGASPGFDVRDAAGREWSVKLGIEAQSESAVSRLLWAAGFHQPTIYYLDKWTLVRDGATTVQPGGRFRLKPAGVTSSTTWAWHTNPFVGTDAFGGLFVLMAMVNNWDLKTSNNVLYEFDTNANGPKRWFVVKDLGASLGRTGWTGGLFWHLHGTKNDLEDFEREKFITRVRGNRVRLHFQGGFYERQLPEYVTTSHVRWVSERLARLSDSQWQNAFLAGGYTPEQANRYVRRMKQKVADGLSVESVGLTPSSSSPRRTQTHLPR